MFKTSNFLIISFFFINTVVFAQEIKLGDRNGSQVDLGIINDTKRGSNIALNPNAPQSLQFQLLAEAEDKPPYRLPVVIQRSNCSKKL